MSIVNTKSTKAPAKAAGKPSAKIPAKNRRKAMLARLESVRMMQRKEGHFDCFGRATSGYCNQGGCAFHDECLSVSRM
jgi:hypothetical protein